MTEVRVELPDELAEEIARRAAALGTTAEEWVAAVVQDLAADPPGSHDQNPGNQATGKGSGGPPSRRALRSSG